MREALRILVVLAASCVAHAAAAGEAWSLARQSDGISVYTRRVDDSPLKAFKGEIDIDASVARVLEVLGDPDSFAQWLPDAIESHVVRASAGERFVYVATAAPWPVSDRDGVYHFTYARDSGAPTAAATVHVEALPEFAPRRDGRVRVPRSDGHWRVEPRASGVRVTYEIHADPGGHVPVWLANLTVVRMPFQTLRNLRRRLDGGT